MNGTNQSLWWKEMEFPGSYHYSGNWEAIDHFLCSPALFDGGGMEYSSAGVCTGGGALGATGYPEAFASWSLKGCSDHLPLLLRLDYKD